MSAFFLTMFASAIGTVMGLVLIFLTMDKEDRK